MAVEAARGGEELRAPLDLACGRRARVLGRRQGEDVVLQRLEIGRTPAVPVPHGHEALEEVAEAGRVARPRQHGVLHARLDLLRFVGDAPQRQELAHGVHAVFQRQRRDGEVHRAGLPRGVLPLLLAAHGLDRVHLGEQGQQGDAELDGQQGIVVEAIEHRPDRSDRVGVVIGLAERGIGRRGDQHQRQHVPSVVVAVVRRAHGVASVWQLSKVARGTGVGVGLYRSEGGAGPVAQWRRRGCEGILNQSKVRLCTPCFWEFGIEKLENGSGHTKCAKAFVEEHGLAAQQAFALIFRIKFVLIARRCQRSVLENGVEVCTHIRQFERFDVARGKGRRRARLCRAPVARAWLSFRRGLWFAHRPCVFAFTGVGPCRPRARNGVRQSHDDEQQHQTMRRQTHGDSFGQKAETKS